MVMSIVFALGAALSNAMASVSQHLANVTAPPTKLSWWRQAMYLIRHPVWLVGTAFLVATFVCGAVALYFGELAVVQPLFVTELIFTLALRRLWLRDKIAPRSWVAALVLCAGLAAFLIVAEPRAGHRPTTSGQWILMLTLGMATSLALLLIGRQGSPSRRAATYGAAAAVMWSMDAAFVKAADTVLRLHGWSGVFVHWPVYALIATGVAGELLVQTALHIGPISASQPAMLIVDPVLGIAVGMRLFGDRLIFNPRAITIEIASLTVLAAGVLLTERWAPPHMTARSPAEPAVVPAAAE